MTFFIVDVGSGQQVHVELVQFQLHHLSAVFRALHGVARLLEGFTPGDFVVQFALSNLIVAIFNGLPGLPLDGGRALRALVWRITRNAYRADVVAGWAGRVIALATLASTIAVYVLGSVLAPLGLIFLGLVAVTLWNGATASIRGRGGSALMRCGVSPDCTQRQNFFSACTRTLR